MTRSQKKKWFGVKTLYRACARGRPTKRDRHYQPDATLIEERVVLVRAADFDHALKGANREALAYARDGYENLYGQKIETTFLGACDAFELFDPPGPAREVYSRTEIASRRLSNAAVVKQLMGPNSTKSERYARRQFVSRTLAGQLWPDVWSPRPLVTLSVTLNESSRHHAGERRMITAGGRTMRLAFSIATLALVLSAIPASGQTSAADREAVRQAALDYVEGVYNVQPERIERSVHPTLVKRGFYKDTAAGPYVESPMTYDQLVRLAGNWNKEKKRDISIKEVAVLDVLDQTAVAKVTANWGIDYMLLAKFEGRWKITQILWQSHPPKGSR